MIATEQISCSSCLQHFNKTRSPMKLPTCKHHLCEICYKNMKATNQQTFQCSFCGVKLKNIGKRKLQVNRLLAIKVKEMGENQDTCNSINCSGNQNLEESINELFPVQTICEIQVEQPVINSTKKLCQEHDKPFDIICTTDMQVICSHCAIFKQHKNHSFKTMKEFNADVQNAYAKMQTIKQQKYQYDKKMNALKDTQNIQNQFQTKKQELLKQLKVKFESLIISIQQVQQKVQKQIIKSIEKVFEKTKSNLFESQNKVEIQYNKWQSSCQDQLELVQQTNSINQKIKIIYGSGLSVNQGETLIKKLNNKMDLCNEKFKNVLNSVHVMFHEKLDLSNFAKVIQKDDNFVEMIQKIKIPNGRHVLIQDLDNSNASFVDVSKQDFSMMLAGQIRRNPAKSMTSKKVLSPRDKNNFYLSPNKKSNFLQNSLVRNKSNEQINFSCLQSQKKIGDPHAIVAEFIKQDLKQVLDLSKCNINDELVIQLLKQVKKVRKIRGLKLNQNQITDEGLENMMEYLGSTTNLNLSYNKLSENSLFILIKNRDKISPLRIVNLSFNDLNQKKSKTKIDTLKKMGIIINT